jgi:chromate transporter
VLRDLAVLFGQIGLIAVGGINAVIPEMQRQVVSVYRWMPAGEFASLFALAQSAPGPNMLVATLVGWRVAGAAGALTATFSIVLPPCLLTYLVAGAWHRFRAARWRRVVQLGLTPVTVGLVLAAALLLARSASADVRGWVLTVVSAGVLLRTRLHPLWVLALGAAAGLAGVL